MRKTLDVAVLEVMEASRVVAGDCIAKGKVSTCLVVSIVSLNKLVLGYFLRSEISKA